MIDAIGDAIGDAFSVLGQTISNTIFDAVLRWFYEIIYGAIADFFTLMGNMGADIFELSWIQATVKLFTLIGWGLFVAGLVVAIFDMAIDCQNGSANIKSTCLHILMGFMCCSMIGVVPIRLYKFCITLQNTFSHELASIFAGTQSLNLSGQSTNILVGSFHATNELMINLFNLLIMIAFAYCVIKIFFQNIPAGRNVNVTTKIILRVSKSKENNTITLPPDQLPEPDDYIYMVIPVMLPTDKQEEYTVTIYREGVLMEERVIPVGTISTEFRVSGKDTMTFAILIDNEPYTTMNVTFVEDVE